MGSQLICIFHGVTCVDILAIGEKFIINYLPFFFITVPITYAWRDELEKKTQNALQRAMGNIPPASRAGLMSRSSSRGGGQFDGLGDNQVSLDLM